MTLCAVFVVVLLYFLWLERAAVFPDPDSFYHVKMAQRIAEHGVTTAFPWLPFTTLARDFADQHFLYHVFLVPFVTLADPIVGAKAATALVAAGLVTLIAGMLLSFKVRGPLVVLAILLVSNPWLFRMGLTKAPAFSLLFLIGGLWLLFRGRIVPLAVLAFLYVWSYGAFVLLPAIALLYVAVSLFRSWRHDRGLASVFRRFSVRRFRVRNLFQRREVRSLLAVLAGTVLGVVSHPYFPQNLTHLWQQLVEIGIVNYQAVVNVGGEWRPYGLVALLINAVFVTIAVLVACAAVALRRHRQSAESWTLLIVTVALFLMTLKSRRYVELYVPFAMLFAAFAVRDALAGDVARRLLAALRVFAVRRVVVTAALGLYLLFTSVYIAARDVRGLASDLASGIPSAQFQGVGRWLAANTPAGSVVVTSDWDEFPPLFYHDDANVYIAGLDPTFLYAHDARLYERWAELTSGRRRIDATRIITQDLKSATVVVSSDHAPFRDIMDDQTAFEVAYEDADAAIYVLKER